MKLTQEQRDQLNKRGEKIGLYYAVAHECISEEQQDVMLDVQKNVHIQKWTYLDIVKNTLDKPSREYAAAQQKLNDLITYAARSDDIQSFRALQKIELKKSSPRIKKFVNEIREHVNDKLDAIGTSPTRQKILADEYIKFLMYYDLDEYDDKKIAHIFADLEL